MAEHIPATKIKYSLTEWAIQMLELIYFKIHRGDNTTPNIIENCDKFNIMLQKYCKIKELYKDGNIPIYTFQLKNFTTQNLTYYTNEGLVMLQ
jgi:hypothetical protein